MAQKDVCSAASKPRTLGALYVQHTLFIFATGEKPTPCHRFLMEPLRMPNHYQAKMCLAFGTACAEKITPYQNVDTFLQGPAAEITIHHAEGTSVIPVARHDDPILGFDATSAKLLPGGGEMPTPFILPLRAGKVFEASDPRKLEPVKESTRHEATGYSREFSFDEAFQDAVNNLPPDTRAFPDKMISIQVSSVGAILGGIAGTHKMYVSIVSHF